MSILFSDSEDVVNKTLHPEWRLIVFDRKKWMMKRGFDSILFLACEGNLPYEVAIGLSVHPRGAVSLRVCASCPSLLILRFVSTFLGALRCVGRIPWSTRAFRPGRFMLTHLFKLLYSLHLNIWFDKNWFILKFNFKFYMNIFLNAEFDLINSGSEW